MNNKIGVVILNYLTYNDTVNCVECALKLQYDNFEIVVVENGSPNESYEELSKTLSGKDKVTLLKSEENLGFARGNNLGIRYAHENLGCDIVFVTNSDVTFESDLLDFVKKENFDGVGVASPTVYNPNGKEQNPAVNCDSMPKHILHTFWGIFLAGILDLPVISSIYGAYSKKKKSLVSEEKSVVYKKYNIQGSCYFLMPDFFKYYTQLYPKTFLYWEENNLLWYLYKANLTTKAVKTSHVIHMGEGSTTEMDKNKNIERHKLRRKRYLRSTRESLPLYFKSFDKIRKLYN